MTCKDNNAVYVTINTSTSKRHHLVLIRGYCLLILANRDTHYNKTLALPRYIGIIRVTLEKRTSHAPLLHQQSPGSSSKWHPQSPTGEGAGPVVSERKLFRSAGHDSGQIRNATPSSKRSDANQRCCCQLRLFSSGLLQSSGRLCARRPGGTHFQTARPQGWAQANSRGSGVCRTNPRSGTICASAGVSSADSEKVCHSGAPSKFGAIAGSCEKKTKHAVIGEVEVRQLLPAAILTEQYEKLRADVLARNRSSSLRLGQGVLMARGVAAWIQVVKELVSPMLSAPSPSIEAISVPPLVLSEVIQLMGGAVMTLMCRGSL
jgi:hypothetical protein